MGHKSGWENLRIRILNVQRPDIESPLPDEESVDSDKESPHPNVDAECSYFEYVDPELCRCIQYIYIYI